MKNKKIMLTIFLSSLLFVVNNSKVMAYALEKDDIISIPIDVSNLKENEKNMKKFMLLQLHIMIN